MIRATGATVVWSSLLVTAVTACGDTDSTTVVEQQAITNEDVEPGPIELPLGCAQATFATHAPLIPIAPGPPGQCIATSTSHATRMLDDCEGKNWTTANCEIPFGAQFCHDGEWTVICRDDAQCPIGMRCTWGEGVGTVDIANWGYGWCAKTCAGIGVAECIRCDMQCNKDLGVCLKINQLKPLIRPQ